MAMDRIGAKKKYVGELKKDNGAKYAAGLKKKYAEPLPLPPAPVPPTHGGSVPDALPDVDTMLGRAEAPPLSSEEMSEAPGPMGEEAHEGGIDPNDREALEAALMELDEKARAEGSHHPDEG